MPLVLVTYAYITHTHQFIACIILRNKTDLAYNFSRVISNGIRAYMSNEHIEKEMFRSFE